jgi:hypothetical protein
MMEVVKTSFPKWYIRSSGVKKGVQVAGMLVKKSSRASNSCVCGCEVCVMKPSRAVDR